MYIFCNTSATKGNTINAKVNVNQFTKYDIKYSTEHNGQFLFCHIRHKAV